MSLHWTRDTQNSGPAAGPAMQQHPSYAAACRRLGCNTAWLVAKDGDVPVGSALAVTRRVAGLVPVTLVARGPVWTREVRRETRAQALSALPRALGSHRALTLVSPDEIDGCAPALAGYTQASSPVTLARLDLVGTPEAQRARQNGKWRNRLCKSEAAGITVSHRPFALATDRWLLETEVAQRRARGYRGLPPAFAAAWADTSPAATVLFTATHKGNRIAAMLFLLHPPGASYHIGWSGPEGRRLNAHNLLLWKASLWLASDEYREIDLGRLAPQMTPGLDRFKLGSGARPTLIGPTFLSAPLTRTTGHITGRIAQARNAA